MVAMLNSARRLKKTLKDLVKRSRRRQARRYAVPLRSAEIAVRHAARAVGMWHPEVVEELIVSLTSFPVRIGKLHLVVRGLLEQSLQPRKIVLYLSQEEFPARTVPKELAALAGDRFEIRFVEGNLRPYKKLLYALSDFPAATIITVDDDTLYPSHSLARLWEAASANPETIVCVRGRRIEIRSREIMPYLEWPVTRSSKPSFLIFPVGGWGILYPPRSLHPMIVQMDLVKKIAPPNDDVWFKAMSLLQDVPCYAIGSTQPVARLSYKDDRKIWDDHQQGHGFQQMVKQVFGHFGLTVDAILAKEAELEARKASERT
jgi:Glycosyl transferase family 2